MQDMTSRLGLCKSPLSISACSFAVGLGVVVVLLAVCIGSGEVVVVLVAACSGSGEVGIVLVADCRFGGTGSCMICYGSSRPQAKFQSEKLRQSSSFWARHRLKQTVSRV